MEIIKGNKVVTKFKRICVFLLFALLLLCLTGCGAKEQAEKIGTLEAAGMAEVKTPAHIEHRQKEQGNIDVQSKPVNYSNISSALLDLRAGKLKGLVLEGAVADYVVHRNPDFAVQKDYRVVDFSMITMEKNQEVYEILNSAIVAMKADGTLDRLVENELQAYIESDPEPVVLPKFGFGRTIKIGVTGDLPPMDYVAANGKPAGFNMALLAEIASRAQVNIEVVHIETGARPMALSSGKVDAVFWTKSITCPVCKSQIRERFTDAITTESYFSDVSALVMPKPGK